MNQDSAQAQFDIFSLACLTTLVFLVLKIFNLIAWNWIWVFSPLLFYWGLGMIAFSIYFIFALRREYKNNAGRKEDE